MSGSVVVAGLETPSVEALLKLRESTVQMLNRSLQGFDGDDHGANALDGGVPVGNLSVGVLRQVLEGIDDELRDRESFERASVDQWHIFGVRSDERFKVSDGCNEDFVGGPLSALEPFGCFDGDGQMVGDGDLGHHGLRFVARAGTRYVAGALFFVAAWQLQRMGWVRRAAMVRPSDSTKSGGAA